MRGDICIIIAVTASVLLCSCSLNCLPEKEGSSSVSSASIETDLDSGAVTTEKMANNVAYEELGFFELNVIASDNFSPDVKASPGQTVYSSPANPDALVMTRNIDPDTYRNTHNWYVQYPSYGTERVLLKVKVNDLVSVSCKQYWKEILKPSDAVNEKRRNVGFSALLITVNEVIDVLGEDVSGIFDPNGLIGHELLIKLDTYFFVNDEGEQAICAGFIPKKGS